MPYLPGKHVAQTCGPLLYPIHVKVKTGYVPEEMGAKPQSAQPKVKTVLKEKVPYHDQMFRPLPKPIEILNLNTTMGSMTW